LHLVGDLFELWEQNEELGELLDRAGNCVLLEWQQCYGSVREENDVKRQQAYLSNSCVLHGQTLVSRTNNQWYITQGTQIMQCFQN